jgi:hypothetical protein
MQSSEIGNTFQDYDQRTVKVLQLIQKDMKAEALQEMENRRQTVFNAFNEFTPTGKSLAILVKRIDKTKYKNFAPDDLDRCLDHLERIGLGYSDALEQLEELKKKIETELVVYFPDSFPKNGDPQSVSLRVKRMNAMLDRIIEGDERHDQNIFEAEKELLERDRPKVWNIWKDGNMERTLEVDFQKFGVAVTENTNQDLETISTFTFYATVEHLKDKYKK